jgi:hypothetical protein
VVPVPRSAAYDASATLPDDDGIGAILRGLSDSTRISESSRCSRGRRTWWWWERCPCVRTRRSRPGGRGRRRNVAEFVARLASGWCFRLSLFLRGCHAPATCGIASRGLRRSHSYRVDTPRVRRYCSLRSRAAAGTGRQKRLRIGGTTDGRKSEGGSTGTENASVARESGSLGATFDGSRNRVDNARVWGRRERIQRFLGPSIRFGPGPLRMRRAARSISRPR